MLPVLVLVGLLGLAMGSFANVPIHRWPLQQAVTEPRRSYCPSCGDPIAARDNVPVLAWLLLRGRCRHCGVPIHWRYPAIELLVAVIFVVVTAVEGITWMLPALLAVSWSLVVASAIDLEHRIIPNRLTYRLPFVLLALLFPPTILGPGTWADLARGLLAAVAVPAVVELLSQGYRLLRGRRGFGLGDVKLLVSLGLVCGYLGVFEVVVLVYGAVVAAVVAVVPLLLAGRAGVASRIPFGPYLAVGAMLAILFGDALEGPMLRLLGL